MIDREKVIKGLQSHFARNCEKNVCPYWEYYTCAEMLLIDTIELLKEQEKETDQILKVVRDVIYSGVSTDTEPDQDYVYELIRNGIQQSYMERQ